MRDLWQRVGQGYVTGRMWLAGHHAARRGLAVGVVLVLASSLALSLRAQWGQLAASSLRMDVRWLLIAAGLYPLSMALSMVVWHGIAARVAGSPTWQRNLEAYNLVNLGRSLPGIAFHIAGRFAVYEQWGIPRLALARAMALEATLHPLVGGVLLAGVVVGRLAWSLPAKAGLLGALLLMVAGALARWGNQVAPLRVVIGWVLLYAATWGIGGAYFHALLQATGSAHPPGWLDGWYMWLVGSMVSYLATYLLGGLSILREMALVSLLAAALPLPMAVAVVVWSRLIGLLSEVGWSALVLMALRVPRPVRGVRPLLEEEGG